MLTGNERRHQFGASRIADAGLLAGIVSEVKPPPVVARGQISSQDEKDIARHFAERDAVERELFGNVAAFPDVRRLDVASGMVNGPSVGEWLERLAPDFILLFGTSIIKAPLLSRYADRVINVHLGLSPYYRGSATNFWPLVYDEPECVGVTIHLAVAEVDAGAILAQARPHPEPEDRAHHLGTKAIIAGFDLVRPVLNAWTAGQIRPVAQTRAGGKVCRRADFTGESVRKMWNNFESGMLTRYIADRERRDQQRPIVETHLPRSEPRSRVFNG